MEKFSGKRTNSNLYVFSGYTYHKDKRCQFIYRCSKRRNFKCQGKVEQEGETYILIMEHDHPPNATSLETLKMKKEMKEMCKNRDINNKEIFDNISRRYPEAAVSLSYNTFRTSLHREKIKYQPPLPLNFTSLRIQLQTYQPLKDIYKGHAMSMDGKIALIFSSNTLLKEFASSTEMYLDGTFSVVPRIPKIAQLYTIHIRYSQTAVASIFILFETRTKSLYDAVWIKIKELVPDFDKNIKFIMLDYESAAGASVSEHFPSASIHGCWFHYNQAVFRKWKSLNLLHAPCDVLSMTMTLPLVPPKYFLEAYKIIEKQADTMEEYPDIHLFLAYLRRNWLHTASKVSVYKCPARTNNVVESFNNVAFKKFSTKHPNLWIFLEKLSDWIKDQELDLGRAKKGLRVRRICTRSQKQKDLRIIELQEDFITGKISLQHFLKMFDNEHECQQYRMQKLICKDDNDDDDINLEYFAEVDVENGNTPLDQMPSRQVNVLAHSRGRKRTRLSLQRSPRISPRISDPERRRTSEQVNTLSSPSASSQESFYVSPEISNSERRHTSEQTDTLSVSSSSHEMYEQRSSLTSREDSFDIENVPHDIRNRSFAASQYISPLNSSDEDIYRIPEDDYSSVIPIETQENEDIPYHPVLQSEIRTSDCCTICLVEKADHVFIPCGHLSCCKNCILKLPLKRCPICNVDYNSYLKIIVP